MLASKKRGENFTTKETMHFVTHTFEVVPICSNEWQLISAQHVLYYPERNRDALGLQCKFNVL